MAPPTHLLILGASRGGTTLLATALGAHPQIGCLDEDLNGAFNLIVGGKIRALKLCIPNHVELTRRWNSAFTPGLWFGATRKSLFMNKRPNSPLSIRELIAFGDTQCVLILRDPRAVIGSIGRREHRNRRVAAYRWTRSVEVADALARAAPRPAMVIDFDRLVCDPATVLQAVCTRLDVPYTQALLDAPSLNSRYPETGFDKGRTGAAGHTDLDIDDLVSQTTMATYRRLCADSP